MNLEEEIKKYKAKCKILGVVPLEIEIDEEDSRITAHYVNTQVSKVIIPDFVTKLGYGLFAYKSNIEKVHLKSNIEVLGREVFSNCGSLQEVVIDGNIDRIPEETFMYCGKLKRVQLNSTTLKYIDKEAFGGCSKLEKVVINSSIQAIKNSAFISCIKLKSIDNTEKLRSIGQWAFCECRSLKAIELGKSLRSIGKLAFSGSGLTEITIPESTKIIGERILKGCESLTKITILGKDPTKFSPDMLIDIPQGVTLVIHNELKEFFKDTKCKIETLES